MMLKTKELFRNEPKVSISRYFELIEVSIQVPFICPFMAYAGGLKIG
jgi:hypothetical protein